mmetsp:Transcript_12645/g.26689  ORF Transcript_12645/g.26689 Transcript_12645/m.26689 type:complete len:105 (-) Transcript_12645:1564-1878(-)
MSSTCSAASSLRNFRDSDSEVREDVNSVTIRLWGILLILLAIGGGGLGTYALVVSKMIPEPTGVRVLDTVQQDWYYCMLVPLTIPVTIIAVYANWVSMKFFKHA